MFHWALVLTFSHVFLLFSRVFLTFQYFFIFPYFFLTCFFIFEFIMYDEKSIKILSKMNPIKSGS